MKLISLPNKLYFIIALLVATDLSGQDLVSFGRTDSLDEILAKNDEISCEPSSSLMFAIDSITSISEAYSKYFIAIWVTCKDGHEDVDMKVYGISELGSKPKGEVFNSNGRKEKLKKHLIQRLQGISIEMFRKSYFFQISEEHIAGLRTRNLFMIKQNDEYQTAVLSNKTIYSGNSPEYPRIELINIFNDFMLFQEY